MIASFNKRTNMKNQKSSNELLSVKKLNKRKQASVLMALLPLSACSGGSGGGRGGGSNTPPAPLAEFIEEPTGVFIALDNRDTTLEQGDATTDLTVTGKSGNDIISTGSGADIIDGAGGNDQIRAGAGADTVNGGAGNDAIVVIGTTTASQYETSDITNAGNGYNLSSLISLADLNDRAVSEISAGEVIDGGSGTNTLFIYGTVDLTGVTLSNITILEVHSDVTLTAAQLAQFTTIDGDGNSAINIVIPAGSPDTFILDLSVIDITDIGAINFSGNLTVKISDVSDFSGITTITSTAGSTLILDIIDGGTDTTVSLADIADTFEDVDEINLDNQVTLTVSDPADITDLGLTDLTGTGKLDTEGNGAADTALAAINVDAAINTVPYAGDDSGNITENQTISVDVLLNDDDSDGDAISLVSASAANGQGSASIVSGEVQFNPGTDFDYLSNGQVVDVTVIYVIDDGKDTSEGTLTITVTGTNDLPVANADIDSTTENAAVTVDVLDNDVDPDNDLSITNATVGAGQGSVTIVNDEIVFTPGTDFDDLDEGESEDVIVDYTITGGSDSESTTLTITVNGQNDAPDVVDDTETIDENETILVDVLANDSDVDDSLIISNVSVADGKGSVSIVDGKVQFDPGTDFDNLYIGESELVEVTYTVFDGEVSVDGTLTLTINGAIEEAEFNDGSNLTTLSLDSNSLVRGEEGIKLNFAVDGGPVTITVEVTDTYGNDHLFSMTGTNGTMVLPMDGTERSRSTNSSESNVSSYEITSIYFEDESGGITYLNNADFTEYEFDTTINVTTGTVNSGTVTMALTGFDISSTSITLGEGETPQMIDFSTSINYGEIDGVLVKFLDGNGLLHSNYINASSGNASLSFNQLIAKSGTYTLYSVDLYDHDGNVQSYSQNDIETLFGASETSFTLTNSGALTYSISTSTISSYLTVDSYTSSGIDTVDGLLTGYKYEIDGSGDPLIITYSFADPDISQFVFNYSGEDYEDSNLISQLSGEHQDTVREMLSQISEDVNIIFIEVPDEGTSAGNMRFTWTESDPTDPDGIYAWAYYPGNYPAAGDVWLSEQTLMVDDLVDVTDSLLKNTILHEVGHALGLKHTFEDDAEFGIMPLQYDGKDYTFMAYDYIADNTVYYNEFSTPTDLMWFDIQALQYLYGANDDFSAGDDVYYILPEEWNYKSIWDSGGNDTFDASHFTTSVTLDLTPGNWSDVGILIDVVSGSGGYNRTDTLHISPDTYIENAIGGSANDVIIGNDISNIIDGGAGADIIFAGDGDDYVVYDSADAVNGGNGRDTLVALTTDLSIDLGAIDLADMEVLQLTNAGEHNITISLQDVIDITDADDIFQISGDSNDSVTSSGQGWTQGADQMINTETYHVYTAGGATLLVDEDIIQIIT